MIKHIWSLLCRRSVIDSESNNISINDVFEQLTVDLKLKKEAKDSGGPINIPLEFEVVSMWVKENKQDDFKGQVMISVYNPEGKEVKTFPFKLDIPLDKRRMRSRLRIMGIELSTSGNYIFKVNIKEDSQSDYITVAELPLEVNVKKENIEETNKEVIK